MLKNKRIYIIPIIGFVLTITITTILLMLPISNTKEPVFSDAIFTAVSATCVTGLSSVNISENYTFFGQVIIALTIQIGAIGVITFIAYILSIKNKKTALSNTLLISNILNDNDYNKLKQKLKEIIKYTLVIELIGAIFLSIKFIPIYGIKQGLWCSIFHAITAFCNAGFDILGDSSFVYFANNIYINIVLMFLMFFGGIGFFVIEDLINCAKKRSISNMRFHTKMVIVTTSLIFIFSAILIKLLEPNLSLLQALFTSITLRTTGLYTVEMSSLTSITKAICIILMLIGGSPGSTSGGIRVITVAVLVLTVRSVLKGTKDVVVFFRKIDVKTIKLAVTNLFINIGIILVSLIIFTRIQDIGLENILFICTSAISATGLSTVDIGQLTIGAKIILMLLMFIGRVGAISIISAFSIKKVENKDIDYVTGNLIL